jgi:hypothetical protein
MNTENSHNLPRRFQHELEHLCIIKGLEKYEDISPTVIRQILPK